MERQPLVLLTRRVTCWVLSGFFVGLLVLRSALRYMMVETLAVSRPELGQAS
jgi:hypothetical protein